MPQPLTPQSLPDVPTPLHDSSRRAPARRGITLRALAVAFALAPVLAACGNGSSGPVDPDEPPVIEITGVEEGAVYTQPVIIEFSASPAGSTISAELNGEIFRSGNTVDRAGHHTLRVEAFRTGRTSQRTVSFRLEVSGERVLVLRMLDLGSEGLGGGGDAILLSDSSSLGLRHGMIDAGPRGDPGPSPIIDEGHVARELQALGVDTLEFLQLTHAHADHFGGMVPILDQIHVRRFVYNGQTRSFGQYQSVLSRAQQRADTVIVVRTEWDHELGGEGGARTVHLPPLPYYIEQDTGDGRLLNEGSLGTYVEAGGIRLFFTGDGEDQANQRWRTQFSTYTAEVDVLKVGHHGANNAVFDDRTGSTSAASAWLDHTRPRLLLVTANGRSHPRQRATHRLVGLSGIEMYCTHVHGRIEVRVAEGWWDVTPERNAGADCVPGEDAST